MLSEEDDEYNSDSSLDVGGGGTTGVKSRMGDPLGVVGEIENFQSIHVNLEANPEEFHAT